MISNYSHGRKSEHPKKWGGVLRKIIREEENPDFPSTLKHTLDIHN